MTKYNCITIINHWSRNEDYFIFETEYKPSIINGCKHYEIFINDIRYRLCLSFDIVGTPFEKILEQQLIIAREEIAGAGYTSMTSAEQKKLQEYFDNPDNIKALYKKYDIESFYNNHDDALKSGLYNTKLEGVA